LEDVPVSEALTKLASQEQIIKWALSGGDDYELCFTVPPEKVAHVEQLIQQNKLAATAIGEIERGNEVTCFSKGKVLTVNKTGYQHFDDDVT